MITRWHWVRHAPTHARTITGWTDTAPDLSDTAAIARLDACLPQQALLVASDLSRARLTADALAGRRTRLPDDRALRESHHGDWEGRSFTEIALADPDRSRACWENPGDAAPPGGESWNQLAARVAGVVDRHNPAAADIIAVAHSGVILTAIQRASGMSAKSALSFVIDPLSVTRLEYLHGQDKWRIACINHVV